MTNALSAALAGAPLTMSTVEIADRTKKRPADVARDVRVMLEALGEDERKFASIYRDATNREKSCYLLPKRECLILVSGYSVSLRAAIVARWAELEAQVAGPSLPDFTDPAAAARAWAERFEGERRALAAKEQARTLRIAAQAKTEALKRVL